MGQAFRRSVGRSGNSIVDTTSYLREPFERTALGLRCRFLFPVLLLIVLRLCIHVLEEGAPRVNMENVLEDRDPKYDDILEMGEAAVVEKYTKGRCQIRAEACSPWNPSYDSDTPAYRTASSEVE